MPHDDWDSRREPLLDRVYARGQELRRRRQMAMGIIAAALVVLIAVPAVALTGGGGGHRKVNTIGAPTTSAETVPDTAPLPETTTSTEGTTTTTTRSTTTTSLVCRNSTNPKCGPFRWDPAPPPNQPGTTQVTFSPPDPQAGEKVIFHIVADDPDAPYFIFDASFSGFPTAVEADPPTFTGPSLPDPHGPWTPPAPRHGHEEWDYPFTWPNPGTQTATFTSHSSLPLAINPTVLLPDPYESQSSATVTVVVAPASTTTTTTTTVPH